MFHSRAFHWLPLSVQIFKLSTPVYNTDERQIYLPIHLYVQTHHDDPGNKTPINFQMLLFFMFSSELANMN